jgi:hypothetical protein
MLRTSLSSNPPKQLQPGDYIKVEFEDAIGCQSEWMWILLDFEDRESGLVFGYLDNEPALYHGPYLSLGSRVAVDHCKTRDFRNSISPSAGAFTLASAAALPSHVDPEAD